MKINENYLNLEDSYLFTAVNRKVEKFKEENPNANVIRLGIGDVTLPLCKVAVDAMVNAALEMGKKDTFRGYGPEQGYAFLRDAVKNYYATHGVEISSDEILISDGAKSDLGNILDIFSKDNTVLIPDPVYPVYVDTNIMDGRKMVFVCGNKENSFLPSPADIPEDAGKIDIIYICSPNNPTGAVYTRKGLSEWVNYARSCEAVILFDAAYESFIGTDTGLPRSIYEIEGAKECAIEFCSFSKTAGFTGTRCGYTLVPNELVSGNIKLRNLWLRRQTTKFNGVSYPVQRAAAAVLTPEGLAQCRKNIAFYKGNAKIIADALDESGISYIGGKNSPYIWLECPEKMKSWDFFDFLLSKAWIVGTPGSGFGKMGEGYFRLTGFGDREKTLLAAERIKELFR